MAQRPLRNWPGQKPSETAQILILGAGKPSYTCQHRQWRASGEASELECVRCTVVLEAKTWQAPTFAPQAEAPQLSFYAPNTSVEQATAPGTLVQFWLRSKIADTATYRCMHSGCNVGGRCQRCKALVRVWYHGELELFESLKKVLASGAVKLRNCNANREQHMARLTALGNRLTRGRDPAARPTTANLTRPSDLSTTPAQKRRRGALSSSPDTLAGRRTAPKLEASTPALSGVVKLENAPSTPTPMQKVSPFRASLGAVATPARNGLAVQANPFSLGAAVSRTPASSVRVNAAASQLSSPTPQAHRNQSAYSPSTFSQASPATPHASPASAQASSPVLAGTTAGLSRSEYDETRYNLRELRFPIAPDDVFTADWSNACLDYLAHAVGIHEGDATGTIERVGVMKNERHNPVQIRVLTSTLMTEEQRTGIVERLIRLLNVNGQRVWTGLDVEARSRSLEDPAATVCQISLKIVPRTQDASRF